MRYSSQKEDEIVYRLAKKHNLPVFTVRLITTYITKFIKDKMRDENMENFHIPGFGKFAVKQGVREAIKNHGGKRSKRRNSESDLEKE